MKNLITRTAAATKRFTNDENGLAAMEYGILAGLVAVVIIGAVTTLGSNLKTVFTTISGALSTATASMKAS
ncbi:Flp family type IVb pilin [Microvirga sp. BT688]|uniref:Flp family type IVb pilin n=1 Tax=Microvirga sp. TaxID=1873136 RepID=UPI001681F6A7|nr:Flp family type IVb pilin [Microvirga sp.]MBD2745769.1 Flp family type IVb pilin [Microvirga sp.]